MPADVLAEPVTPRRDPRGFVVEPLGATELAAQRNVHVVWTAPGAIRGNHYHARGTEVALVLGPALVRYRNGAGAGAGVHDVRIPTGVLWRFRFPPGVAHAFGAVGPDPMLVVGFNTEPYDSGAPDVVMVTLLESHELTAPTARS